VTYGPARARYERRKRRRQRQLANAGFWNVLSIVFGISTVLLAIWFVRLYFYPDNSKQPINNLSMPMVETQSTAKVILKTTEVPSGIKSLTKTTPAQTQPATTSSNYTFDIQAEQEMISANLFRNDRKCNWIGVAGQVFDLQGRPVPGITIQVTGPLYGNEIHFLSLTGAAPWYGTGGYEVFLSDKPLDSTGLFQVQLVDQSGNSLSPGIKFNTSSDCKKNLSIINFRQVK
jgi:hypothetical protein